MKKRILAAVLIMVFALASVMGVSAAGSKDGQVTVTEQSKQGYIIRTDSQQFMDDQGTEDTSDDAFVPNKSEIEGYNAEKVTLENLLKDAPKVLKELEGKTALTKIFDLHDLNGGKVGADGKHRVTINVPSLSTNCKDVKVLHYSMETEAWEILKESTVDLAKKQVTIVSDDLSPIAIFATVSGGSGTGSSPATGMESSTWMIFAAVALVAAGSVVVISRKKRA